jgi:hypothetical protein
VLSRPLNARIDRTADAIAFNLLTMGSFHPGGLLFLFCDDSVHFISESIDTKVYEGMETINGGEIVAGPVFLFSQAWQDICYDVQGCSSDTSPAVLRS